MLQRCNNPRRASWVHYGGRGIRVCERWLSFVNFLADMGERPAGLTLERVNNDGNYEPDNCRWASAKEQVLNTRRTKMVTIGDTTKPLVTWCVEKNININTVRSRVWKHGYTYAAAIMTPVQSAPWEPL